jgi:SPP1 family predicted phage head-tail adaptor
MAVGGLRHQVSLQKPSYARDTGGGTAKTYTTLAKLYAKIKPVSGSEKYRQGQVQETVTHHVTVRFRSDIGTDMRIQYQARNFNIKHIRNVDERDRFLLLMCNEGEAT